jgi:UrcA family protein
MRNIVIIAGCLALASQASAQQRLATVPVSPSDVANGRTSDRLQSRIEAAIGTVCGSNADTLEQFVELARCRKQARADAIRQITAMEQSVRTAARDK